MRGWMVAALLIVACGGDDSTDPGQTYENIAGAYSGTMTGVSQGVALNGTFSLNVTQSDADLSGTYSVAGTLTDGVQQVPFEGTGVLDGTIESGDNPSVNITATNGTCTNQSANFTGTYDSANERINLQGPVDFFDDDCSVILTFPMNFVLDR